MAHSPEIKSEVRRLYLEGMNLKQAASRHNVNYQTAQNWKRKAAAEGDNWDHAKASYRLSASGLDEVNAFIIEDFTLLYQSTVKEVAEMKPLERVQAVTMLADAYTKFVGATAKGTPKFAKIGVAMDVLKMVLMHIKEQKPHLFDEFSELLEPIGVQVQAKYEK